MTFAVFPQYRKLEEENAMIAFLQTASKHWGNEIVSIVEVPKARKPSNS